MQTNGLLRIEKRPLPYYLILWIVALPLLWGAIFQLLQLPDAVKYTADVAWLVLLGVMIWRRKITIERKILAPVVLVLGFFIYCLVCYLFNYQSFIYFLWGLRNNFRYYVFFFAIVAFLREKDAENTFRVMDALFWINIPIVLVQYYLFRYERDYLGGIFGTESGVNAVIIIFFTIVISRSALRYMEQKESFALCAAKCIASLMISVLAELKFYFVFFVIILVMAALLTSFSFRKLLMLFVGSIAVYIASVLLVELFGFENFMSLENIWKLATQQHYSTAETVNRLSAIPTLIDILVPEWQNRFFGFGLGNCDTSAFPICNTPFYQAYGYLRYTFFSCAFLFLEVGYIGLVAYVAFFILCAALTYRRIKAGLCNTLHGRTALIMAVLSLILVVYNSSLRAEAGYMVYFILALPFLEGQSSIADRCITSEQEDKQ